MKKLGLKTLLGLWLMFFALVAVVFVVKNRYDRNVLGEADINTSKAYGLVIPHHDLAKELIMRGIESTNNGVIYENIVIIGPNHYYPDGYFITTADTLGTHKIKKDFVRSLSSDSESITTDNKMLAGEHGVNIPLIYLNEVYPEAEIIPLAISTHGDQETMDKVSQILANNFKENTLFILAIDFAHNVGFFEGVENNEDTIEALSNFDYETIKNFDDKHLDSTLATTLFLKIMEKIGSTNWETLESSHGSVILGIPDLQGTSYVTGIFTK